MPELQSLAIRILSQTASSSEAERIWSLFGFVQNKRRCRLKADTLEKIVYIHANTRLIDKVNEVDYEERYVDWQTDGATANADSATDTDCASETDQSEHSHSESELDTE